MIELIGVIAIVALLVAILIPSLASARSAATKARVHMQFNEWATAIESYRSEYGAYPVFDAGNLVNPVGQTGTRSVLHLFHDLLAARRRDGSSLPAYTATTAATAPEAQNRKQIVFYSFGDAEFTDATASTANLICDAAHDSEIAVLVDRNLDGLINSADFGETLPAVHGMRPNAADFPASGVRAGVVFYAAESDATLEDPKFIFSWK
jgi:type II secretory pathway pseudopilin PulG